MHVRAARSDRIYQDRYPGAGPEAQQTGGGQHPEVVVAGRLEHGLQRCDRARPEPHKPLIDEVREFAGLRELGHDLLGYVVHQASERIESRKADLQVGRPQVLEQSLDPVVDARQRNLVMW
jgi:hypothetical protein